MAKGQLKNALESISGGLLCVGIDQRDAKTGPFYASEAHETETIAVGRCLKGLTRL